MTDKSAGTQIVERLRSHFPNPVAVDDGDKGTAYCVGGAVCIAAAHTSRAWLCPILREEHRFPSAGDLAEVLRHLYPQLEAHPRLEQVAGMLIRTNDTGNFEAAWKRLENLLNWEPAREPIKPVPKPVKVLTLLVPIEQAVQQQAPPSPLAPEEEFQIKRRSTKGRRRPANHYEIRQRRMAFEQRGLRIRFRAAMRHAER